MYGVYSSNSDLECQTIHTMHHSHGWETHTSTGVEDGGIERNARAIWAAASGAVRRTSMGTRRLAPRTASARRLRLGATADD